MFSFYFVFRCSFLDLPKKLQPKKINILFSRNPILALRNTEEAKKQAEIAVKEAELARMAEVARQKAFAEPQKKKMN